MAAGKGAEIAVIGGGVIGCSIAYHLAQAGMTDVVLFEREAVGSGATSVAGGGIRQQFEGLADCLLARYSVRFYEQINDILEPEFPFEFERCGYLFLADSSAELERYRSNVEMQNGLGIPSRLLTPAEVSALVPDIETDGLTGGSFCPADGFLEDTHGVTHALARRAQERGAAIHIAEVTSLRRKGRSWQLSTAEGLFEADRVIVAAGVDTVPLAAQIEIELPVVATPRRQVHTMPAEAGLMAPLVVSIERGFAGKQRRNGSFHIGWLAETTDADDATFAERALGAGASLLPALAEVPIRRVVRGIYDMTPDHRPILGPVLPDEGLYVAVGFSGHGYMIAPAVGAIIASCLTGKPIDLPIEAFAIDRFRYSTDQEGLLI